MKNLSGFLLLMLVALGSCVKDHTPADVLTQLALPLSPFQESPVKISPATGTVDVYYNKVTKMLNFTLRWNNLSDIPTGAHIHGTALRNANTGIKFDFFDQIPKTTSGTFSSEVMVDGTKINETDLLNGLYYFNVHTKNNPGGEIRGQIEFYNQSNIVSKMGLQLSGKQENPANMSTATGTLDVSYNKTTKMLNYFVTWNNLVSAPTGAHIHGPAVKGTNTGILYDFFSLITPTTSGGFSNSVLVDGVKLKEADLLNGQYYVNIHNAAYPGGEIRAQIEF